MWIMWSEADAEILVVYFYQLFLSMEAFAGPPACPQMLQQGNTMKMNEHACILSSYFEVTP